MKTGERRGCFRSFGGLRGSAGYLVRGLEGPFWVILHVTDAPHGLDLRQHGPKLRTLLKLSFLEQILVASVSWVLIAHPAVKEIKTRNEAKLLLYRRTCPRCEINVLMSVIFEVILTCHSARELKRLSHGIHERGS